MDAELYTVYVFYLKNGMRFLYPKNRNIEDVSACELIQEFKYTYRLFNDEYQVVDILRTHTNILHYNINSLVLYHMHIYGVEKIRGGKYSKMVLTTNEKDEISNLIKYFSDEIQEEGDRIARYHNYNKEYASLNEAQIWTERTRIDKILLSHNSLKQKYEKMNIVSKYELDEINWLKQICESEERHTHNINNIEVRYNNLMKTISNIYQFYKTNFENAEETIASLQKHHLYLETTIWFYSPRTFFDNLIIHKMNYEHHQKYMSYVFAVIDMIFYTIYNKSDELAFDMKSLNYTENLERNHTLTILLKSMGVLPQTTVRW